MEKIVTYEEPSPCFVHINTTAAFHVTIGMNIIVDQD